MIDSLIETGLSYLILGLALLGLAYLLPGIYKTLDNKDGIKLFEEREATRQRIPPRVALMYILTVVLWPTVDWEMMETQQNWATYMKQREDSDDRNSDEPPTSSETDRKGGD